MIVGRSLLRHFFKNISSRVSLIDLSIHKETSNPKFPLSISNTFSSSSSRHSYFVFSFQSQPQLLQLELKYRQQQKINIFEDTIKQSTGILDQLNIFKIFKVMQSCPYNIVEYTKFFDLVNTSIKRKSDNMLILLAIVKSRMAKYNMGQKNYHTAIELYEEALEILQQCMVPQLLQYYSIYRQYGLLFAEIGDKEKAMQILTESVNILDVFVKNSDADIQINQYCKKQATAYNVLSKIDDENRQEWVQKALVMWELFTDDKYLQVQYAKTVANNLRRQLKQDESKGQSYYNFVLYQFQNEEMKQILTKAKEEVCI